MKIIGGHDFYDGAGWGIDPDIVFVRKERILEETPFKLPRPLGFETERAELRFFRLLVGGQVFPGLEERHRAGYRPVADRRKQLAGAVEWRPDLRVLHFDPEDAQDALVRLSAGETARRGFVAKRRHDRIETHFATREKQDWTDWMISEKIATGINEVREERGRWNSCKSCVRADTDEMGDMELYRVLDPASTHMALSSWIGGVLPSGPETVEIGDRARIVKAGFDTETSFRRAPGEKKPRRKTAT